MASLSPALSSFFSSSPVVDWSLSPLGVVSAALTASPVLTNAATAVATGIRNFFFTLITILLISQMYANDGKCGTDVMYAIHGSDAALGTVVKAVFSESGSNALHSRKFAYTTLSNQSALR